MIQSDKTFEIHDLDSSGFSCFSRCPARYMFERLIGLKRRDHDTKAVDYGTDFHLCAQHCYSGKSHLAVETFMNSWRRRGHEPTDARNEERAVSMIEYFVEQHHPVRCAYEILNHQYEITPHFPLIREPQLSDFDDYITFHSDYYNPAADANHDGVIAPFEDYWSYVAIREATDDIVYATSAPRRMRIGISLNY